MKSKTEVLEGVDLPPEVTGLPYWLRVYKKLSHPKKASRKRARRKAKP